MAVQRAEEIIQQINEKIGALQMALLLNYFPEKIQDAGGQIKCFCPLHKEQAFRSLHLETKTHTFNCKMKRCPGFEGGTFVDLYCIHLGLEPLEAALEIAEKLRLDIDVQALRALGGQMVEKAREAISANQLDLARQMIDQAVAFNPKDVEAGKLSAQIYLRAGEKDRAVAEFMRVVDMAIESGEFEAARQILNPLIANEPRNVAFAERRVSLARSEGAIPALLEALLVVSVLYQENGAAANEIGALDQLMSLEPTDSGLLERVIEIQERSQRPAKAIEAMDRLAPIHEVKGEWDKLAPLLARRLKLDPENLEVRERMARTFIQLKELDRAAVELFAIAEAYRGRSMPMRAQAMLNTLLEIQPENIRAMESLASLSAETGHAREAIDAYRKLANLARQRSEMVEAVRYLNSARAIDPNNHNLRMDLVETHLAQDQTDLAIGELFGLADIYLNEGAAEEGFAILNRVRQLVPDDISRQIEIGRCLEAAGYDEQALESHLSFTARLEAGGALADALNIANEARRLAPRSEPVNEAIVRITLAMGRPADAITACRNAARAFSDAGDYARAEASLRRGAGIDANDALLRSELAAMYELMGREVDAVAAWLEVAALRRSKDEREGVVEAARNALRIRPESGQAKAVLAEALEAGGRVEEALALWASSAEALLRDDPASAQALGILTHALELTPADTALIGRVARLRFAVEGEEEALELFERWIESARSSSDAALLFEALAAGVELYPTRLDWRSDLAGIYAARGEKAEASAHLETLLAHYREEGVAEPAYLRILDHLVRLNPDRMDLRLEWAEALAESGEVARALEIFTALAAEHQAYGDDESCLIVLRKSLARQPENRDLLQRIGELEESLGRVEEAIAAYEALVNVSRKVDTWRSNIGVLNKLLSLAPDRHDLRLELARNYEEHADIENAVENYLTVARFRHETDLAGDETLDLLGKLASLAKPDFAEAREMLVDCHIEREEIPSAKLELDKLGDQALRAGDLDRGERMFRRIQEIDPEDIGSAERLGRLYETKGETEQAVRSYRQALSLYEREGDVARMISALRKLTGLAPKDLELRRALARRVSSLPDREDEAAEEWYDLIAIAVAEAALPVARESMAEAESLFAERWDFRFKLIQIFGRVQEADRNVEAWREFVGLALEAGKDQIAREGAVAGLEIDPNNIDLLELRIEANGRLSETAAVESDLRRLAELANEAQIHAAAELHLRRAIAVNPGGADLWRGLADAQAAQGKIEDASASLHRLAELCREIGDVEEAIEHARRRADLRPDSVETKDYLVELLLENGQLEAGMDIWREIAELFASEGELHEAMDRCRAILSKLDRDIPALRRLADLTREADGSDEAAVAYAALLDVMIEDASRDETLAEFDRVVAVEPDQLALAEKRADYFRALERTGDAVAEILRIAAVQRDERGDLDEALRLIRRAREWAPDDQAVMEAEAGVLEAGGDREGAAAMLRMAANGYGLRGQDGLAIDALARRADILSDRVEAQVDVADACEMQGEDARATDFLVRAIEIQRQTGEVADCIPVYRRAMGLNPDRLDLPAQLAQTLEAVGETAEAVEEWLRLAARHEELGDPDAALEICQRLKEIAPQAMEPRRRIARIAGENGESAMALAELREMAPLALKAADQSEAIGILNRILALDPEDADAMDSLAGAQRSLGLTEDLFATLLRLEQTHRGADRLDLAVEVMTELRALRPHDLDLASQNFDLLVRLENFDEAANVAKSLVESYFDMGDLALAERMIGLAARLEPTLVGRRIEFAELAAAQGYGDIALRQYQSGSRELLESGDFEPGLELAGAGLKDFRNDVELRRRRIEALKALDRHDEKVADLLDLARLWDGGGDDAQAIATLEEILTDHSDHIETHEEIIRLATLSGEDERTHEHLIQLAEIHYANGDLPSSIQALRRLLELAPNRVELRIRLAELYHELGDSVEALQVWFAAAESLRGAGQLEEAINVYEAVRENYPDDVQTLARLTETYRQAGRDDEYLEHATRLGDIYDDTGDTYEAAKIFEALTERFPANQEILEKLAAAYAALDDVDGAVRCHKSLVALHESAKRFDLAKGELEKALAIKPNDVILLERIGEACLSLGERAEGLAHLERAAENHTGAGRFDEAREVIERILKIDAANLETRRLLGSVCEALGDITEAIRNYSLAARGWAEQRNNDAAIEVYAKILEMDPTLSEEREAYAQALEREGRKEEVADQYLTLIRSLAAGADPRQVIRYCRQILKDSPDHVEAHIELYLTYERTRKPRLALEEAQWLADYYISIGEMESAEDYIRRGLVQAPGEIELRKRFVEILIETSRGDEAAKNLNELAASARQSGDLRTAKWALARACETNPQSLEYRQEFAQTLELAGEPAEARRVRLEIMRLLLDMGQMEDARLISEKIVQSSPEDEAVRLSVAEIFETAGLPEVAAFHFNHLADAALERDEFARVVDLTDHILRIKPRHLQARESLVKATHALGETKQAVSHSHELYNIYLENNQLEEAHNALKFVIQCHPSDPNPRRLLIDLYRRMKRQEQMVEQMRKLAEIYSNEGDIDNAVIILKALMAERPDDTRARARYIDLYSQTGEESDLHDDYLHLAVIFRRKGKTLEAAQIYEKLLKMDPDRADSREQFLEFLFEQGQDGRGIEEARGLIDLYLRKEQKVEAGRLLEKSLARSPSDTHMRHQLATLQIKTNRRGMALETLRGLLKQYVTLENEESQVQVIEQILVIDNLNVELRERLAELQLKVGQPAAAREHRIILADQYLARQLFDLAEREYQRILETDPRDIEIWQKKIDTHLQIGSESEIAGDLLQMADLLSDEGRLREAVAIYKRLREIDPDNIDMISKYIESYIQIGMEEDLIDDYLHLANLLSQSNNVEGALRIYQHLQEIAPENTLVRAGLSAGAASGTAPTRPRAEEEEDDDVVAPPRPAPTPPLPPPKPRQSMQHRSVLPDQKLREFIAADEPAPVEVQSKMTEQQLLNQIRNYENILKLNPENPSVRKKLAELIARTGRMKEADDQWLQAAGDFFNRGEYDPCIEILTELVGRHPEEARLRERLSRAILQRESLNAIGSILDGPK